MPAKKQEYSEAQKCTPYLLYRDVGRAMKWLKTAFGFNEFGDQFKGKDGKIQHAAAVSDASTHIDSWSQPAADVGIECVMLIVVRWKLEVQNAIGYQSAAVGIGNPACKTIHCPALHKNLQTSGVSPFRIG